MMKSSASQQEAAQLKAKLIKIFAPYIKEQMIEITDKEKGGKPTVKINLEAEVDNQKIALNDYKKTLESWLNHYKIQTEKKETDSFVFDFQNLDADLFLYLESEEKGNYDFKCFYNWDALQRFIAQLSNNAKVKADFSNEGFPLQIVFDQQATKDEINAFKNIFTALGIQFQEDKNTGLTLNMNLQTLTANLPDKEKSMVIEQGLTQYSQDVQKSKKIFNAKVRVQMKEEEEEEIIFLPAAVPLTTTLTPAEKEQRMENLKAFIKDKIPAFTEDLTNPDNNMVSIQGEKLQIRIGKYTQDTTTPGSERKFAWLSSFPIHQLNALLQQNKISFVYDQHFEQIIQFPDRRPGYQNAMYNVACVIDGNTIGPGPFQFDWTVENQALVRGKDIPKKYQQLKMVEVEPTVKEMAYDSLYMKNTDNGYIVYWKVNDKLMTKQLTAQELGPRLVDLIPHSPQNVSVNTNFIDRLAAKAGCYPNVSKQAWTIPMAIPQVSPDVYTRTIDVTDEDKKVAESLANINQVDIILYLLLQEPPQDNDEKTILEYTRMLNVFKITLPEIEQWLEKNPSVLSDLAPLYQQLDNFRHISSGKMPQGLKPVSLFEDLGHAVSNHDAAQIAIVLSKHQATRELLKSYLPKLKQACQKYEQDHPRPTPVKKKN